MTGQHRVTEIPFVSYPATDMARADRFYRDILGLTPGLRTEGDFGIWQEYDIGAVTLAIGQMKGWEPSQGGGSVALEVDDMDATVARLKQHGVRFTAEPFQTSVCKMAIILDSEGNAITLHKRNG